jgi:2-oxoisovalerate dehydrogenase E1 component
MGDYSYRTRDEVETWKSRCPILRLKTAIIKELSHPSDPFDAIESEIENIVEDALQFAESSPWPEPSTATRFVFAEAQSAAVEPPTGNAATAPPREISFMQATLDALTEEMARDASIFVLGEGIGVRGGNFKTTAGLYERYGPVRLRDTPICERGFVGLGCGAAMTGTRPVIDFMFADFVLDAVGEIINQIAKIQYMSSGRLKMPILLRGCIGIGHSAATHHSGNYYAMYAHFPGLRVVVPSTPRDAKGLLKRALRSNDPVIFLEHREILGVKGLVPADDYEIEFGRAAIVREGHSVTVVALALMVHHTHKMCDQLAKEGISVELIDPRTVAPLDVETIARSVAKTGRLLIVDEAFGPFGFGAEIAARLADIGFDDLDAPIKRLNGAFTPTPYSPALEASVVPTPEGIAQAIRDLMAE